MAHVSAEVVVVGAGAAGAALTWRLATLGVDVLCLEQGDWLADPGGPAREVDWERTLFRDFNPNPNVRQGRADYPVADDTTPIKPALFNGVGGSTLRWGAHFPRLKPSDFRVRSLDGVADDWPIQYSDLEHYYDLNDQMMGVSGLAGDPANPPRSPRPHPPLPLGLAGHRLAEAFDTLGWHWWPVDAAIASKAAGANGACNMCGPCAFGCIHRARASADTHYWPEAIAAGARLVTQARVRRLSANAGRVQSVEYVDATRDLHLVSADRFVLAANGLGTTRLLLASGGLANSSGLVGRRLMHHPTAIVTGVFAQPIEGYKGPFACGLVSQEFYETDTSRGFVRGYQMQMLRGQGPAGTALGGYMKPLPWGGRHHQHFLQQFGHSVSLTITVEDLPEPANRVSLADDLHDAAGIPGPRLHYRLADNSRRILDHGIAQASTVMRTAGAVDAVVNPLAAGAGFHFLGTARMGNDAATSVTDASGRCHDLGNLCIADGSVFVTAAAVNPTSTIQALALRIADGIASDLGGDHAG